DRRPGARGHGRTVDAGCQPHEVASRAHELVLRAVRADGAAAGLEATREDLPVPVQLLLPAGRRAALSRPARLHLPPDGRTGHGVPQTGGRVDGPVAGEYRRGACELAFEARYARTAPRAAAPGADADGHQARVLRESAASCLSRGSERDRVDGDTADGVGELRG